MLTKSPIFQYDGRFHQIINSKKQHCILSVTVTSYSGMSTVGFARNIWLISLYMYCIWCLLQFRLHEWLPWATISIQMLVAASITNGLKLYSVKYSLSAKGLSNIMFNIMQLECRSKLVDLPQMINRLAMTITMKYLINNTRNVI